MTHALPNLKTLHIDKCDLSDDILKAIAQGLENAKHIETVFIHGTRGLHVGQAAILNAVSCHATLKNLSFYCYNLDETKEDLIPKAVVSDALQRVFKENKVLQRLDLEACNVFSEEASQSLAETFEQHNKSIIEIDLQNIISPSVVNQISHCVVQNQKAAFKLPEKPKKIKVIRLSREALQYRIAIVENLIEAQAPVLTLKPTPKPKDRNEEPRLSINKEKYISEEQLKQWLRVVVKGPFTGIDLSNESNLPALHQGIILETLTHHYQINHDAAPLRLLDLSRNNLKGQGDKLIALLNICPQLNELKLADVKFKPSEITKLVEALANHPQLTALAISAEPEVVSDTEKSLIAQDIDKLTDFVSSSHTLQSLSLTQGIYDFDSERMCKILEGLTLNLHLKKCVFEIGEYGLDEKLIELIQKTKLNQLTLKFLGHVSGYSQAIKAALSSNQLTQLKISNHVVDCKNEAFNQDGNSKLTHLTLKDSGADTAFLQAIKSLPLTYLDLSNNRLSADKAGKGLIDLLEARAETLESLNLSGHALYSTQRHPYDKNLISAFLEDFSTALGKCKKLKSFKFDSGASAFDVHEIASFIHNIKRNNPSLVVETISLPHNSLPDKEHMFNETSQYLTFVMQDMQQQIDFKPGLSQQAWLDISQRYKCEIARLLAELELVLKEKLNPPQFAFFKNYTDTGTIKWNSTHQALLKSLKAKDYAAFHNSWHTYEKTHSTDDTDINLGVYLGFIDECLLFYARAIKQCQQNGYDWVDAYPDASVLENNYDERLTKLQHDKDEKMHAFEGSRRTNNKSFT